MHEVPLCKTVYVYHEIHRIGFRFCEFRFNIYDENCGAVLYWLSIVEFDFLLCVPCCLFTLFVCLYGGKCYLFSSLVLLYMGDLSAFVLLQHVHMIRLCSMFDLSHSQISHHMLQMVLLFYLLLLMGFLRYIDDQVKDLALLVHIPLVDYSFDTQ